jgi:hypothetical protein
MLLTYFGRQSEVQTRKIILNQQQLCGANEYAYEEIKDM